MRDLITLVATALILLLTAALAGPWFIDWTAHRGWVESELARLTATRVKVNGEVDLKLLPVPKLSLRDVRVPMLIPGMLVNTGPKDFAPMKSLRFMRFDGDHWVPFGDLMSFCAALLR